MAGRGFKPETPHEWTLFIITREGKEFPHWTDTKRERCREERRSLIAQSGGRLPMGVKLKIRRVR